MNHFAVACKINKVCQINAYESDLDESSPSCDHVSASVRTVKSKSEGMRANKWCEETKMNDKIKLMKLDTGAQVKLLPKKIVENVDESVHARPTKLLLEAYGRTNVKPVGIFATIYCKYRGRDAHLDFLIVDCDSQPYWAYQGAYH
jgi:hypothetical protein